MLGPNRLLLVALVFLLCFVAVAVFRANFNMINSDLNAWAASVNSSFFMAPAVAIDVGLDTTALTAFSLAVAALLAVKGRWKYGLLLLGGMGGGALLVDICKTLVASPRPANELLAVTGYSFPSGHVTGSVVFFGLLTWMAWMSWKSWQAKTATSAAYVAVVTLVGFDRVYLNVHWFSDVVGAVFLGAFWLALTLAAFKFLSSRNANIHIAFLTTLKSKFHHSFFHRETDFCEANQRIHD